MSGGNAPLQDETFSGRIPAFQISRISGDFQHLSMMVRHFGKKRQETHLASIPSSPLFDRSGGSPETQPPGCSWQGKSQVGPEDCTPEINTSEIVNFQRHFPMDVQWHFPTIFHFSVVFPKGLSLLQWVFIGIVQWISRGIFQ